MAGSYFLGVGIAIAGAIAIVVWDQRRMAKEVARAAREQRPFPAVPYKPNSGTAASVDGGGGGDGCGGGGDGC